MFDVNKWSDQFLKAATEPMSEKLSGVFINMLMSEGQNIDIPEIKGQSIYQMIDKRSEYLGLEISEPAKIFLMFLSKGSPGNAVMYLSALGAKNTKVDMNVVADLFPMGFVPKNDLDKLWDAQKGHVNQQSGDNCLDQITFQKTPSAPKFKK